MARTMHAAAVEQFGEPLVLREWDNPAPGVGQILVKTEACGVGTRQDSVVLEG
jgi:alcohol dehydrogenase, propanol-preferring